MEEGELEQDEEAIALVKELSQSPNKEERRACTRMKKKAQRTDPILFTQLTTMENTANTETLTQQKKREKTTMPHDSDEPDVAKIRGDDEVERRVVMGKFNYYVTKKRINSIHSAIRGEGRSQRRKSLSTIYKRTATELMG